MQSLSQIRYFSVSTVHCSVSLSALSRHQRKVDVDQGNGMLRRPMIVREHVKQQEHSRLTSNSTTLSKRRNRNHKAAWKLNESRWFGGDIQYPLRAGVKMPSSSAVRLELCGRVATVWERRPNRWTESLLAAEEV